MLDADEITVLVEALEAWVNKDAVGEILSELVVGVFAKDDAHAKERLEAKKTEGAGAKALRKDRAILIQAKLIQMRDGIIAGGLSPSTGKAT